ncbi:MAG TPA: hypothetical protein PLG17_01200 [Thermodesulfobacteriota bacterium]|nr:hypothetical protein [Deltaproteobacteria bacterium]HNU71162.1 hypothetical protein [Thermodesulfobacteriota bacterium]HOC38420.1 hypothetical protein [Thermodesulfobacteriota bacterium]HQO77107.1 hypothetical protein [Thermodesulfobacteriota bacterium]
MRATYHAIEACAANAEQTAAASEELSEQVGSLQEIVESLRMIVGNELLGHAAQVSAVTKKPVPQDHKNDQRALSGSSLRHQHQEETLHAVPC